MPPPSRLDARNRDFDGLSGRCEDGQVDGPVLFGSNQLFAVEYQHRKVGRVLEKQLWNAATVRNFGHPGDLQPHGVGQHQVVQLTIHCPFDSKHCQIPEHSRLS